MATKTDTPRTPDVSCGFLKNGTPCDVHEGPTDMHVTFADGRTICLAEADIARLQDTFAWHGAKQKLIDAAAISRSKETGKSATIADKFDAVNEVYQRLLIGQWNKPRESGDGAANGLLLSAMCRMYAGVMDAKAMAEWLDAKSADEKAALRINPEIAAIMATIRVERAPKAAEESTALLAGLPTRG